MDFTTDDRPLGTSQAAYEGADGITRSGEAHDRLTQCKRDERILKTLSAGLGYATGRW